MSEDKQKKLVWLILSTMFIRYLWTLHPDAMLQSNDIPAYKMFLYSETLITKPTYIYFACLHVVQLINVRVWWVMFYRFRNLFAIWFWIQVVQFGEYFVNYNEAKLWFYIGEVYKLDIDFTLLKLVCLPIIFLLYDVIWTRK